MKNKFSLTIILLLIFFSLKSFSQWNSSSAINTPVSTAGVDQKSQKIVSDTKGGAIIAWEDFRASAPAGVADIYVQRVDKSGYPKWTLNGINICANDSDQGTIAITEDGFGGAIISWNDHRAGDRDIYAQRVDSTGNVLWAANGVLVSGAAKLKDQRDSKLISDGSGGAIVVWQDSTSLDWDIFAQRINGSNGAPMWTASGVSICNSGYAQKRPRLRTDGAGGAIIVWQDHRSGNPSTPAGQYDIWAQRVDGSGNPKWTTNGIYIRSGGSTLGYTAGNPIIESDGLGGAIIAWEDRRNDNITPDSLRDIYAQRVDANGSKLWTTNGVPVCTSVGSQIYLDMTTNGISGAVIVWKDFRTSAGGDIYAQKIDLATGASQWTANGVAINATVSAQGSPSIIGDGSGNIIIAYEDYAGGLANDIYSVKINSSGVIQWTSAVSTADSAQTSPKIISDGAGGCIYSFEDKRSATFDIYAHHLDANGMANGIIEENYFVESKCFPNPFFSQTTIVISNIKSQFLNIKLYDVFGRKVEANVLAQPNGFIIQKGNLGSGVYFYEIISEGNMISNGKLIINE